MELLIEGLNNGVDIWAGTLKNTQILVLPK
jgi:hypothetical protein